MLRGKFCANTTENINLLLDKGFSFDETFNKNNFCDFISINENAKITLVFPDDEYYLNRKNKISDEELTNPAICSLDNLEKEELIKMYISKCNDLKNLALTSQEIHRTLMNDLQEKFDNYKKMIISKNIC